MKKTENLDFSSRFKKLLNDDFIIKPNNGNSEENIMVETLNKPKDESYVLVSKWWDVLYTLLSVLTTLALIMILLVAVNNSPEFGNPSNPAMNEVALRYVEQGIAETGATNIVAGMILDYRAFDTFGEAVMMFTAAIGIIGLFRKDKEKMKYEDN